MTFLRGNDHFSLFEIPNENKSSSRKGIKVRCSVKLLIGCTSHITFINSVKCGHQNYRSSGEFSRQFISLLSLTKNISLSLKKTFLLL